jgi:hypothetical protein
VAHLRAVALALSFVLAVSSFAGGTLFDLRNPGDGGRQLTTLDPATGVVTPVSASISPPLPSASGVNGIDAGGKRFFFIATPTAETDARLYTVDTQTGVVLSNPTLVGSASAFFLDLEYDEAEGVLYGLRNPGTGARELVTLDVTTGAVTPVSAALGTPQLGTPSGVAALDAAGNRFFFTGTPGVGPAPEQLYVIDTATGALLSSPVLGTTNPILGLDYDPGENALYAMRMGAGGGKEIAIIDPATGAQTVISPNFGPGIGVPGGTTTIDPAGNRYFFIGVPPSETDFRVYSVDTATGTLLASPVIVGSASAFVSGIEWAEDPVVPPVVTTVLIDVLSTVNVRSRGVIPVALLTTPSYDATSADVSAIRFGPGNAIEAHGIGHPSDVDGDGDVDLVLHFRTQDAAIPCTATTATLTGTGITGTDTIKVVGCK